MSGGTDNGPLLDLAEAARMAGKAPCTVYRWRKAGCIPDECLHRVGGKVSYKRGPWRRWLGLREED